MARRSSARFPRVIPADHNSPNLDLLRVDRHLADLCERMRVLKYITPVNARDVRKQYLNGHLPRNGPDFLYRIEDGDWQFDSQKSQLLALPIEGNDELAHVFRQKRDELYDVLTMLQARGTSDFVRRSRLLFGTPTKHTVETVRPWMALPPDVPEAETEGPLDAEAAAVSLRKRATKRDIPLSIRLRRGLISTAAAGESSIGLRRDARFTEGEVERIFVHEAETHILRNVNGARQPFRTLFYYGFPRHGDGEWNYMATEEGLATLAEELSGQLTNARRRVLAARVLAVYLMDTEGLGFNEVFDHLTTEHDLDREQAFTTTMRAFRGGGYTKDHLYLQGYLMVRAAWHRLCADQPEAEDDGQAPPRVDFTLLFTGKVGLRWVPLVERLYNAGDGILQAPRVLPTWFEEAVRKGDGPISSVVLRAITKR